MCQASLLAPYPNRPMGSPSGKPGMGARVIRKTAAASPMLMPSLSAAKGLATRPDTTSSDAKPLMVSSERLSTPPHSTASHSPSFRSLAALARARAPDVQAVEMA